MIPLKLRTVGELAPHLALFAGDGLQLLPFSYGGPDAFVRRNARVHGDRLALRYRQAAWTWSQLHAEIGRWAQALLDAGFRAGDHVALMMDNRPEFLFFFHAANRLGVTPALINTSLQGEALAHVLQEVPNQAIFVGEEHVATMEALAPALPMYVIADAESGSGPMNSQKHPWFRPTSERSVPFRWQRIGDLCCYIYTSGTTGFPKAALIRSLRIVGAGALFGRLMHRATARSRIYIVLPLYHTNALGLAWGSCLATGAAAVLRRRFSVSQFWDDVADYGVTSFVYIGEICRYLTQAPPHPKERRHRMRVAVGNGARREVAEAFADRFGVEAVREFYGSTEGDAFTLNFEGRPGFIGQMRPLHRVLRADITTGELLRGPDGLAQECAVGEIGLLVSALRNADAFDGYSRREESEKKLLHNVLQEGDVWFNTGDLVRLHARRWLSFEDRMGDTYRWKGENVSTAEVEALLSRYEGVQQVMVFGVALPTTEGRAGMAAMHVADDFDIADFGAWMRTNVPRFQQPRFVRILDEALETTATHKLRKAAYAPLAWREEAGAGCVYMLEGEGFVRMDSALEEKLASGDLSPA